MAFDDAATRSPLRLSVVQLDFRPRTFTAHDSLWIPAEPLVSLETKSRNTSTVAKFGRGRLFSSARLYNEIEDLSKRAVTERLHEVLAFLGHHHVDIVVFPEYLVPIDCLPILKEFSQGRAIVAGLEQVRNSADAKTLAGVAANWRDPSSLLQRNVSVLVTDGNAHLITKKYLADNETAEPGDGPLFKEVVLKGRPVRLGVAVCMDFLRSQDELRSNFPEIVCIPAYSPKWATFQPDAPRDYVRLFANCTTHGGSQIIIPALRGALANELGVLPISSGFEAVMIVEYDRFPQQPTPLCRTENNLLIRAEIIEKTTINAAARRALQILAYAREQSDINLDDLQKKLVSCRKEIDKESPLVEALNAYLHSLEMNSEDRRLRQLASTHLMVEPGRRSDTVRRQQAQYIVQLLIDGEALKDNAPAGAAKDAYEDLVARLPEPTSSPLPAEEEAVLPKRHLSEITEITETSDSEAVTPTHDAGGDDTNNVRFIHPGVDQAVRVDLNLPSATPDGFHICDELVLRSQALLDTVRELAASASPDDFWVVISRCRSRAARVADLLRELDDHVSGRTDFEWDNMFGAARRNLSQLRRELTSTHGSNRSKFTGQLNRSSLRKTALELHRATVQLRNLIR